MLRALFTHEHIKIIFQEKATMLSLEMGHDEFTASNGWLEAWQ